MSYDTAVAARDPLTIYMAEVKRYPVLSREEERRLAMHYQENMDPRAAHALVVANLRYVVKIAQSYRGYGLGILDLIQEGNTGLMTAVKKFDPRRGYRLISYAVWWIKAYMQNFIVRSWSLVKIGTTQAQRKLFFRLRSAKNRAEALHGRDYDLEAVAEDLGVSTKDAFEMGMRMAARDFSLDQPLHKKGANVPGARLGNVFDAGDAALDSLVDDRVLPDVAAEAHEMEGLVQGRLQELRPELNLRERYILERRLMTDDPETLQSIGEHFKISRERARQIQGNVVRKVRGVLQGITTAPRQAAFA